MSAAVLIEELRHAGLTIYRQGDQIVVSPRELLSPQLREAIRNTKGDLLKALQGLEADQLERRRSDVLEALERQPKISRAFIANTMADGTVTIVMAIRGVGSGQLTIPAGRYDPAAIIELFDNLEARDGAAH